MDDLFLIVLEAGECKIKVLADSVSGEDLLPDSLMAVFMLCPHKVSLVAQMVKHLPTMQEIQVRSLGREDSLEKKLETHSSTLAWKIPWMEEPGRLQSMGSQRVEIGRAHV